MILAYDLEIKKTVKEVGGWDKAASGAAGIACACVQDPYSWKTWTFLDDNIEHLPKLLDNADLVITWNGNRFDDRVLKGCGVEANKAKRFDILATIWKMIGFRKGWTLNETAERNIKGAKKLLHGFEVPELYKQQRFGELITYCARDTWLVCQLFRLIKKQEFLLGPDGREIHFPKFVDVPDFKAKALI